MRRLVIEIVIAIVVVVGTTVSMVGIPKREKEEREDDHIGEMKMRHYSLGALCL